MFWLLNCYLIQVFSRQLPLAKVLLLHLSRLRDDDILQRSVVVLLVGGHILDLIYHVHAFQHLAKHGVSVVEMRHATIFNISLLQLDRKSVV